MRKVLWLAMLLPLVAGAASMVTTLRMTPAHAGNEIVQPTVSPSAVQPPKTGTFDDTESYVGKVDSIGGSTYDIEFNGPPSQTVYVDPAYGIHTCWMFSADLSTADAYPDRNMRYNFFDFSTKAWAFPPSSSFMDAGINVFSSRCGYGCLDVHPSDGIEYISAHAVVPGGAVETLEAAQDASPGVGAFSASTGTPSFAWPAMGVSPSGNVHIVSIFINGNSQTDMYYTRIHPWGTWSTPESLNTPAPEPGTPDYNIATSKKSSTVAATWAVAPAQGIYPSVWRGYYKKSTDDGATWSDSMTIPFPNIYEDPGLLQPTFIQTSLYPYFDMQDSLHVVATVIPLIEDSLVPYDSATIADWSTEGGWRIIDMARTDTMAGRPQLSFEAYADRATMAVGPDGEYVCVWEQFDSLNADPDGELRCDIVASVSTDNGVTWSDPCRFAHGGTVSRRYPCVARNILHGDSLAVVYLSDLQAGCSVPVGSPPQAVGSPTKNPFICQRVPIPGLVGVAESRKTYPPASYLCQATPSVFRGRTKISYSLPRAGDVKLRVFDAVGRPVKTLVNANVAAGRYTTTWDGRTDKGLSASAGIYFYTLSTSKTSISKKLTLLP